jgi:DNA-3-methyladenine glycosylase II
MNSEEIEKGTLHIFQNDPKLKAIIEQAGTCTLKKKKDYYHSLLTAIVGQQLSLHAARAINKRLFHYFNGDPAPDKIYHTPDDTLRNLGLSWGKVKYIKDLSHKIIEEKIHFNNLGKRKDSEIIADFTQVKGIGVWTVQMFLIFTLARPDVLPLDDLGIKKGIVKIYNLKELPDEEKIKSIAKKYNWSPYSSIASWYIWRSLELN